MHKRPLGNSPELPQSGSFCDPGQAVGNPLRLKQKLIEFRLKSIPKIQRIYEAVRVYDSEVFVNLPHYFSRSPWSGSAT